MSFLSNSFKRGPSSSVSNNNNFSESTAGRYKDENQFKASANSLNSNSSGLQHSRPGSQGLTDLTNIIKPTRGSLHSEERSDKPQNISSAERLLEEMGRSLTEVLNDLRSKLSDVRK